MFSRQEKYQLLRSQRCACCPGEGSASSCLSPGSSQRYRTLTTPREAKAEDSGLRSRVGDVL